MTGVVASGESSAGPRVRLRDLDDEAFRDRYSCDRFSATVLTNRFRYVVAHTSNQFRRHAFSPIIRDAADMCCMLSGPAELGFPMAAVSETLPLFYGSIPDAVRIVLEEYGIDELVPGDVVFVNDYYRVGTHLNDACCIRPIFIDGHFVGAITIRAHLTDIGGIFPGGFDIAKRNVWEDGLHVPPMLLCAAGKPVTSVLKLINENSRFGRMTIPDLLTEVHALELGERLLQETIEKYGLEAYHGAMRFACDASAETMADALAGIPDGVYEGEEWLDGDGLPDSPEYGVKVRITKVGTRAEFDLRGSSGPTRSAMNCAWPDIKTGIAMGLKFVLDPRSPVTSGTLRGIDVVVPPEAIFNAAPPRPCQFYWEVVMTLVHAIFQALNPVLGKDAVAAATLTGGSRVIGRRPDGTEWPPIVAGPTISGAWGATRHGDADSSQQPVFQNLELTGGVESYEREVPAIIVRCEYMPDTAGPGTNRGGAANLHETMWTYPVEHRSMLFHSRRPVAGGGVCGGGSGPTTTVWVFDGDVTDHGATVPQLPMTLHDDIYRRAVPRAGMIDPATKEFDLAGEYVIGTVGYHAGAGSLARVVMSGGGGWGDPYERDPERVLRDVRDEYVSFEGAARDYGVVVTGDLEHPEKLEIDTDATTALRATRVRTDHEGNGSPRRRQS